MFSDATSFNYSDEPEETTVFDNTKQKRRGQRATISGIISTVGEFFLLRRRVLMASAEIIMTLYIAFGAIIFLGLLIHFFLGAQSVIGDVPLIGPTLEYFDIVPGAWLAIAMYAILLLIYFITTAIMIVIYCLHGVMPISIKHWSRSLSFCFCFGLQISFYYSFIPWFLLWMIVIVFSKQK